MTERKRIAKRRPTGHLFLSHSQHDDEEMMWGAVSILEEHGALVYIDERDRGLDELDPIETARHLRTQVTKSSRLVVLFSDQTARSRWIPWELGLGDGNASRSAVATLPFSIDGSEGDWGTQHYFAIYPQIRRLRSDTGLRFVVVDPMTKQRMPLERWLGLRIQI